MSAASFDSSRFPFVTTLPPSETRANGVQGFYREWDVLLARGPHVLLVDLRRVNASLAGAGLRREVAEAIKARRNAIRTSLLAEARLVSGPLVRGLLTAVDWLVGDALSHPIRYFDVYDEAERWLELELGRAGLALPPRRF
jgi:hypothetical protein